jgi:ABC-type transporter Mla MlaB component
VLKLEGKLLVDWIGELQDVCRTTHATGSRLRLDLSGLSFVDVAGTITLRELMRQGAVITNTSPFVGELLKEI